MSGNRIFASAVVALIHIARGYALVTGLAYSAAKKLVERVTTVDIEEPPPPEEEPPPPPPDEIQPPPVVVPPAPIPPLSSTNTLQDTVDTPPPPQPPVPLPPRPNPPPPAAPSKARGATPDGQGRWAARIQENYPARAIRDETEGSVGVRVTISAQGRVT